MFVLFVFLCIDIKCYAQKRETKKEWINKKDRYKIFLCIKLKSQFYFNTRPHRIKVQKKIL